MTANNSIETDDETISLKDNQTVCLVIKPNSVVDLKSAKRHIENIQKVSDNQLYPLLVDLRVVGAVSKEARDLFRL